MVFIRTRAVLRANVRQVWQHAAQVHSVLPFAFNCFKYAYLRPVLELTVGFYTMLADL